MRQLIAFNEEESKYHAAGLVIRQWGIDNNQTTYGFVEMFAIQESNSDGETVLTFKAGAPVKIDLPPVHFNTQSDVYFAYQVGLFGGKPQWNKSVDIEKILEEIFAQSPLPNRLKQPKSEWKSGKMRETQKVRIVEEYSSYKCSIVGYIPD